MPISLQLRWLLRLWVLLVATALIPPATFAYDGQNQTTVAYDTSDEFAVGYDAVSVLTMGEKKSGPAGDRVPFAKFAEFVAAKTTAAQNVFWSGGRAAEDAARTFANANNGVIIGDTAAGRALAQSTAGVPWSQARPQWLNLSQGFARSASGEVNVFQNAEGVYLNSIWRNEYQTLMQNPNVTRINFNVVMPNGSVVPVP